MRYRDFEAVGEDGFVIGLKFLVSVLDEMLFPYTLDTYKPSVHNASTLCYEALSVIDLVESGAIDSASLDVVIEELIYLLSSDAVASQCSVIEFEAVIESAKGRSKQLRSTLELLKSALAPPRYVEACKVELEQIVKVGREKKRIIQVARSFVTSLLGVGYTKEHISRVLAKRFYSPSSKLVDADSEFGGFLREFDLESKLYSVDVKCDQMLGHVEPLLEGFSMEVVSDSASETEKPIGSTVRCRVRALDPFAAARSAEEVLDLLSDLLLLFHHKQPLQWGDRFLVREWGEFDGVAAPLPVADPINVSKPKNPMANAVDRLPRAAALHLKSVISELQMPRESLENFQRIVSLHGAAVRSQEPHSKLLSVWTALEALVPSCVEGAKVKRVEEALMPFLLSGYPSAVFDDLLDDFQRWRRDVANQFLPPRAAGRSTRRVALCELLVCRDHEARRNDLMAAVSSYPLLRARFQMVVDRFGSPKSLKRTLDRHEKRVSWQLRRIYRCRNLFIHNGVKSRYVDVLIENAHSYLDVYINSILEMSRSNPRPARPEEAWILAREKVRTWRASLDKPNVEFKAGTIESLAFGV